MHEELDESVYTSICSQFSIWDMKFFEEYMMKYCLLDVNTLSQIVDIYSDMVWTEYKFDLLNYISIAQLSKQNWLTHCERTKLDVQYPLPCIADEQCYNIIYKSLFGGRCEIYR